MQTIECSECGETVPLAVDTSMTHPHNNKESVCMNCWIDLVYGPHDSELAEKEEKEL